jgi:hypothetical protein
MNNREGIGPLTKKPAVGNVMVYSSSLADPLEVAIPEHPSPVSRKTNGKGHLRRETGLVKDSFYTVVRNNILHVISENYYYKTEPYYTILRHELEGRTVSPSSSTVLDAYVVPICLERAKLAGISVCPWEISQAYIPLPAIVYGLNYFATSSDYFVVDDNEKAKDVIKHITNKGKYPFCYQKLEEDARIHTCTTIFGKTAGSCSSIAQFGEKLYDLFSIPLVNMIFVQTGEDYALSSLSPVRYSQLSDSERKLISAYMTGQEFL